MNGFIAVHSGAGNYNESKSCKYKEVCKQACLKGIKCLNDGGCALDAITVAIEVMENCNVTNAGFGSNLTVDGKVECDAGVMDGLSLLYGSVGAVSRIKNPVRLAKLICDKQKDTILPLGRIPPCSLVGDGALEFARHDPSISIVHPEALISKRSLKLYSRCKKRLDKWNDYVNNLQQEETEEKKARIVDNPSLDTVGAVCVDKNGNTAAASSSGGIILKHSGRLGPAAVYGCGCWAENKFNDNEASVAVVTSGSGEYIIKTCLAREVARRLKTTSSLPVATLKSSVDEYFNESPFLKNIELKQCGLIAIYVKENAAEFLWAHTTADLCLAYMSLSSTSCTTHLSHINEALVGRQTLVSGINII